MSRELDLLPLEQAIHKMTGATARALKLKDRGLLRPAFAPTSPSSILPTSGTAPATPIRTNIPTGARTTVIVNGTVVVDNATHTGALPGQVLRRDADGGVG